ncbi:MAG: hypothetical protein U5J62_06375 [Desulfurivibrio sp.]|nr:hypothetical protein [Desulfurivibrio sp.]
MIELKRVRPGRLAAICAEFSPAILDDQACKGLVIRHLHGEAGAAHPACPFCSTLLTGQQTFRWSNGQRVKCRRCRKSLNYTSGTILDGLHISARELVLFAALVDLGCNDQKVAELLGRDRGTIKNWRRKLVDPAAAASTDNERGQAVPLPEKTGTPKKMSP